MSARPAFGVSDVVRIFGEKFRQRQGLSAVQKRALTDVGQCRTAVLGGHVDACDGCGTLRISYNSCRNRHCPKCQNVEREAWILGREEDLLPVAYYHVVFTIPLEINDLCQHNPRFLYDSLFESAWQTLRQFAADAKWSGAKTGATMVLHTWGQNLSLHPHVHAIVPAGGLSEGGVWKKCRATRDDKFLFPVRAMSKVFRAVFLKKICPKIESGELVLPAVAGEFDTPARYRRWRNELYRKPWAVYAKRPFGGPKQVIEYLGRYTHKSAISNHRLLEVSESGVRFSYKDYRTEGRKKEMTLAGEEFLRRWCLHVLPGGFRRVRHYGILSNALKTRALEACRKAIEPEKEPVPRAKKARSELRALARQKLLGGCNPDLCGVCKSGRMVRIGIVPRGARDPPVGAMPVWISILP